MTSCAAAKRAETAGKTAFVDCGKEYAPSAASVLAHWAASSAVAGKPDWVALEHDAMGLAKEAAVCVYAEAIAAWRAKPTVQALTAGPLPDDGSAGLERLRAGVGGAEIKLADGTVL